MPNSGNKNNNIDTNQDLRSKCPHCGGYFQNERGINIHISRSHPDIYRSKISDKYNVPETHQNHSSQLSGDEENNHRTTEQRSQIRDNNINDTLTKYKTELTEWKNKFSEVLDDETFDSAVETFTSFLSTSINYLPGPKHPATKYYEARKKNRLANIQKHHKNSSNPERANKKSRDKRNLKYNYEVTQFLYHNQRRKAVRRVLESKTETCKIDNDTIHRFFTKTLSLENTAQREEYPPKISEVNRVELDELFVTDITKAEIEAATRRIAVDTAPGPDRVIVRVIKDAVASEIIAKIATRMLTTGKVPTCLKKARTVLIFKGGDAKDLSNWRPITICSVIRRVIERVLDSRLRTFVHFNEHQRGFTNTPGSIINTAILGELLNSTKRNKDDMTVIFLDITKAFDNIGHTHLHKTLESEGIPSKLTNLIINLQNGNNTQVQTIHGKTKIIPLLRGVMQGSPLSPLLYNMATNHILDDLTDENIRKHYGKSICMELPPITVLGFADDTVIIGRNKEATLELTRMAIQRFEEIGLKVNPKKCSGLCIERGKLIEKTLVVDNNYSITSMKHGEFIKYLGVTFTDTLNFDSKHTIQTMRNKLDLLISSPLLKPEQKFQVLNTSICTTLLYPFQTTNPKKIPNKFLNDTDKIIRSSLKEILQLPIDTPDSMLYSDMRFKGLGLFKAAWEAYLQHINTCKTLTLSSNAYISATRNLRAESEESIKLLKLQADDTMKNLRTGLYEARYVRKILREREVDAWAALPQKGLGVELYREYTPANSWIRHHDGLTSSEWRESIKMTANVSAVRAVPGRSQDSNLCRQCRRETETLAHVLGFCPYGETLRNSRHHKIRSMIADELRSKNYDVFEEVHGLATNGSTRRIDIIALPPNSNIGYIIDPTVRFEKYKGQPEEVNEEKKNMYL